jgi:hypothetical protein
VADEDPRDQAPAPATGWWAILRRLLPWGSLVLALVSAVSMDRRPERARLIAAAAVGGWLLLGLFALVDRVDATRSRFGAWLKRAARASTSAGAQSLIQLCLFFALPFFARSVAVPEQLGFVVVLVVAAALTLWTPLCAAILRRPVLALLLQGIAAFAGLDCVLPLLGLSLRASLLAAGGAVVVGATVVIGRSARRRVTAALVTLVALAAAGVGGVASFIPPAPLRLVSGGIGTQVVERTLLDGRALFDPPPERLVCHTAIASPRGLRDRLRHVWRQDGHERAAVALEIQGGRARGFRAWSTLRAPTAGHWSCTIETESGQVLGAVTATVSGVRPPPPSPPP